MPVSRRTTEGLSSEVAAVYGRAEVRLLQLMAKHLEAGTDSPRWVEAKLAELQTFRKRADRIMSEASREATAAAGEATRTAYLRGMAAGQGDLDRAGVSFDVPPRHAEYATEALVRAQADQLDGLQLRIARNVQDDYRDAVLRASAGTLTGAATRVQDAQVALDDLANRGVTGFTDRAGRRWGLESYVDMATRTTTAQAAVQGHLDRLEDGGLPLVVVSSSSRECERCRPWEGKVLSSSGVLDVLQTNVLTGETEVVRADATVDEATRGGLFHPNCTHNLSGYVHGATKTGDAESNPEGYAAQQQQRAMERQVRKWKRREAAAMTPEAKRLAKAKTADWQQRLRGHVAANDLPRKPRRESFDVTPPKVDKWARWDSGRAVRVDSDNLPDFNPDNPLEFYGDRLNVAGRGSLVEGHLRDLESFSEGAHNALRDHFAGRDGAGFYLGDDAVPELDDLGHLRGVQPRGWDEGQTWDNVPGAYNPGTRVCACGGGGKGHGSTSLALHEGSHALDDALGVASRSPEFVEVYHEVHGLAWLDPYFTHPGNPTGYLSEGFAEGYAAFTRKRRGSRSEQVAAVMQALTGHSESGPKTTAAFGRLVDYFSGLG